MKATNRSILKSLYPCNDGLNRAAEAATLREWWDHSLNLDDMMWLVGKAHEKGNLSRRRIVQVALRACEVSMHLAPEAVVKPLGRLCDWLDGDDSIDLVSVRKSLWDTATTPAADPAYFAVAASVPYPYATSIDADASASAYAAAIDAADAVACDGVAHAAMTDVIRDAITIDELCAALNLDPEAGV